MYASELNTPKLELDLRLKKLQDYLRNNNIDAALILQPVDLFYFAGTIQKASLYVPAQGDPILMVHKSTERARAESGIEKIRHLDSPKNIPAILKAGGYALPRSLGLELDVLPANMFFNYRRLFQDAEMVDISHVRPADSGGEIRL